MKDIKVIVDDNGELQSIYVPKEIGEIRVKVIDYYEDADKAEKEWKQLKKEERSGDMIAVY